MSRTLETRNKERVEGKPVVVELSDNLNPSRKTTVFCSKSYGCHVSILLSRVHDASATTATGP